MLETLQLHAGGRLATVYLSQEMYREAGATNEDTEGLIDYPRSIAGVDVVALLKELDDERYKISLRSRAQTADVERVARHRGGGGHYNAAGCGAQGDLETVRREIVSELTEALEPPQ